MFCFTLVLWREIFHQFCAQRFSLFRFGFGRPQFFKLACSFFKEVLQVFNIIDRYQGTAPADENEILKARELQLVQTFQPGVNICVGEERRLAGGYGVSDKRHMFLRHNNPGGPLWMGPGGAPIKWDHRPNLWSYLL